MEKNIINHIYQDENISYEDIKRTQDRIDSSGEVFKTVYGMYDNIFEVNKNGTVVYTKSRISPITGKIIESRNKKIFKSGRYYAVNYIDYSKNKKYPVHVHVLVCQAWNSQKSETNNMCRHLNDDCLDNNYTNLKWGTQSENIKDAIANKKFKLGVQRKDCKLSDIDVIDIINDKRKPSEIAKDYPVGIGHIYAIKKREERKYLDTNIESKNYGKK